MIDSFGRKFEYLRLSLDDACNLKCVYCLPDGYQKTETDAPLSATEVRQLVEAFAGLGFWKVRLTGGEPTTRRDIVELAASVSAVPGVRHVAVSTNGYRLAELAKPFADAGVAAVNVSVDSLVPERFAKVTGRDILPQVLAGIDASLAAGLQAKINCVLLRGVNDTEGPAFAELARTRPLEVRFIELMRTGTNADFFKERHRPVADLSFEGWAEQPRTPGQGPARLFRREGYAGALGLIAPYTPASDFCGNCNRLRVTSRGRLRLCLFAEGELDLRPHLGDPEKVRELVRGAILKKESGHENKLGSVRNFAQMGG
jgi:GTP 3',8-cyclase